MNIIKLNHWSVLHRQSSTVKYEMRLCIIDAVMLKSHEKMEKLKHQDKNNRNEMTDKF